MLFRSPHIIRRAAIASYELEMNLVVHSDGGELIAEYTPDSIQITTKDRGPGIPNVEEAMTAGWSTASEWIRSLGFGAGMGLPNVKSVVDEFDIESDFNGTNVICSIKLRTDEEK